MPPTRLDLSSCHSPLPPWARSLPAESGSSGGGAEPQQSHTQSHTHPLCCSVTLLTTLLNLFLIQLLPVCYESHQVEVDLISGVASEDTTNQQPFPPTLTHQYLCMRLSRMGLTVFSQSSCSHFPRSIGPSFSPSNSYSLPPIGMYATKWNVSSSFLGKSLSNSNICCLDINREHFVVWRLWIQGALSHLEKLLWTFLMFMELLRANPLFCAGKCSCDILVSIECGGYSLQDLGEQ